MKPRAYFDLARGRAAFDARVQAFYAARVAGDFDTFLSCFHEDCELVIIGATDFVPFAGSYRGRQGVRDYLDRVNAHFRIVDLTVKAILLEGARLAVRLNICVHLTAQALESSYDVMHRLTLRDGLVESLTQFADTASTATAFGALRSVSRET